MKDLSDIASMGCGALNFDVEMAREHGWSDPEIADHWESLRELQLKASTAVSARLGHTRRSAHFTASNWPPPRHAMRSGAVNRSDTKLESRMRCECGWATEVYPDNSPHGPDGLPFGMRDEMDLHFASIHPSRPPS